MKRKDGKIPVNARITIDYEKKNPSIKFSYPRKDVINQNYPLIMMGLMVLMLCVFGYFQAKGYPFIDYYDACPTNCSIQQHRNGTDIKNISIECNNGIIRSIQFTQHYRTRNKYFNYINSLMSEESGFYVNYPEITVRQKLFSLFGMIGILGAWFFLIPYLLSKQITKVLVKWGWFKKKIPKINSAISGSCRRAVFKKIPPLLENIIEIPFFHNVKMNYNATGDFSKYLKRVEIKEHPFNKVLVNRKGKIKKKKKNIDYWYARFYFSDKPQSGKLEVLYK